MNKKHKLQTQIKIKILKTTYKHKTTKTIILTKQMSTMRTTVLTFALSLRGSIVDWKKQLKIHTHTTQQTKKPQNTQHKQLHSNNQKRQKINMSTMQTVLAFAVSLRGSIVLTITKNKNKKKIKNNLYCM